MITYPPFLHRLELVAVAYDQQPWTLPETLPLLELVENNGWFAATEHGDNVEEVWQPYDRDRAAKQLRANTHVSVRPTGTPSTLATLANVLGTNSIRFNLGHGLYASADTARLEATVARMIATIPTYTSARARVEYSDPAAVLESMPVFRPLGWLHVFAPESYPPHFDRDILLAAPCRVEERGDGSLWFWLYDHPAQYHTAAANAAYRTLTDYLRPHVKRW